MKYVRQVRQTGKAKQTSRSRYCHRRRIPAGEKQYFGGWERSQTCPEWPDAILGIRGKRILHAYTSKPIRQFRSSFFRRNSSHRDVGYRKREFRQSRRPWKDRFQLVDIQHDLFHLLLSSRPSGNRDSHADSLRNCQRNLHNPWWN